MKKIFIIIGFLAIFFSSTNIAFSATCTWTKAKGIIVPGTTGSVWSCPDPKTKESDKASACSGKQPALDNLCCCSVAATINKEDEEPTLFTMPEFQVEIPGLMNKLATVTCPAGAECEIPWLGQYTKGIYNYLIAIVGVIAALVLMGAGLIWLTSGGESGKIDQAKNLISGAIVGIGILACSYLLLNQINPNLVNLQNIKVKSVKKIQIYADADITVVGGARAYGAACEAAKKNDWSVCKALGETPPAGLVSVEKVKANSSVVSRYKEAMECVKAKNGKYLFYINEAWRSPAKQIEYKIASNNNGGDPVTADPCCSNHGAGQALDINRLDNQEMSFAFNESSGLKKCMEEQTLYAKLSSEPWHFSPTGR